MKLRITVEGKAYDVDIEVLDDGQAGMHPNPIPTSAPSSLSSAAAATRPAQTSNPNLPSSPTKAAPAAGQGDVQSPIAGTVLSVSIKVGDTVKVNDTLMVLEAMKMESNVASPLAGKIAEICVKAGDTVAAGQCLVKVTP